MGPIGLEVPAEKVFRDLWVWVWKVQIPSYDRSGPVAKPISTPMILQLLQPGRSRFGSCPYLTPSVPSDPHSEVVPSLRVPIYTCLLRHSPHHRIPHHQRSSLHVFRVGTTGTTRQPARALRWFHRRDRGLCGLSLLLSPVRFRRCCCWWWLWWWYSSTIVVLVFVLVVVIFENSEHPALN